MQMKRKVEFKSIRTRLTFWFVVVALFPLAVVSTVTYNQRVNAMKVREFEKLTAIRELKVRNLNRWIDERLTHIETIAEDSELTALEDVFNKQQRTENDCGLLERASQLLAHYVSHYEAYEDFFVISRGSEKVEAGCETSLEGQDRSKMPYFTEPIRTGEVYISDVYYSKTIKKPTMAFSSPIYGRSQSNKIIGVLVARIDLEHSLYNLLLDRTGMGETGETLIVNKDGFALNKLRWYENAPLRLKIETEPAAGASQGKTGIAETLDYRGEEVLAAYTYIPRTKWGFVAKQDLKETHALIRPMLLQAAMLLVGSAIAVYLLSVLIARNIARPLQEVAQVSRRIGEGDLLARNDVGSADEIGYLAKSVNRMADSLMSQMGVQQAAAEITETMVASTELADFATALLRKLIDATDSNLGAFYLRGADGKTFDCLTSMGVKAELLEPFDASILEGEFGKVLAAKKISHIKDIPEDTVFKFKTFAGTALPKEIVTIPVIVKNKVMAVISIAGLNEYSKESHEILNQTWLNMNTAFSNVSANEETRKLADELRAKNMELQAQAEELQQQSEELQEQNVELEVQRNQVEEANRLKSEFLSNMSHELRTPLNSIMALSRVLTMQTRQKLSSEEADYLEIIERNGRQLLGLINDILDLSKIESGRQEIRPRLFSIGSTIETIIERLGPVAEEKGIKINQEISDNLPIVKSDEARVHQIVQNLIGNAVKFTERGSVTVSATSDSQKVHIKVADTGIGISREELTHIFEEFRQVDGTCSRKFEGTGLGLAIAHKAANLLGGEISVESAPGKGSTFTLTLPVEWGRPIPAAEEREEITETPEFGIQLARETVLIVDDDPEIVSMISGYLSAEGYNAITATSGRQALKLAQSHDLFAITLDILMPDMDGWEVLQSLKNSPETADIPVIIVSISDDKATGVALGAVGYITKPVDKDALISEIRKVHGPNAYSIMVVDDNDIHRQEMARVIESEEMKPIVADGGKMGIELIEKSAPDVLVLDLMMPEMDGFEVLDRLRSAPKTRRLPVIVVTAKDLTPEDRKKLSGYASSVLVKSDTTSIALLEEIRRILSEIGRPPGHPKVPESKKVPRILLVEDNEAQVVQVKTVLEREGYILDVARGGEQALDYVKHTVPDGIILDLMMPEVDGFEVLDKIRGNIATATIPVLILTAKDLTSDDLSRLSANNVEQLLQKGDVNRQELLLKIKRMLGLEERLRPGVSGEEKEAAQPRVEKKDAPKTQRAAYHKAGAAILVVEDHPDNMTAIRAVLQDKYKMLEATDGEEGLKSALTHLPDLVLLDMSLPKLDGFSVVRKIKGNKEAAHIPVVALTAHAMKGDRENMMEAGCDDYLSKPIDPEETLSKIRKWLDRS
jgi:CheY-like chemotaxis protein/signal transduction histidine kinase/HAMP domain-containing protein